jgi:hypothetical protein
MAKKTIKQLQKELDEFYARGSRCPICKCDFRDEYSCPHSIEQVKGYLRNKIMDMKIDRAVRKRLAKMKGSYND